MHRLTDSNQHRLTDCHQTSEQVSTPPKEVVIGQGAVGSVTRAEMDGKLVAVKNVNPNTSKPLSNLYVSIYCCFLYFVSPNPFRLIIQAHGRFEEMLRELTITIEVARGTHPNIVTFHGAAVNFPRASDPQHKWSIGLVFELCDPYDLYHLLHTHKIKLTLLQKLELARETAAGLAYLHSLNILHQDMGSRNLLIKDRHIRITDFGIARKLPAGSTSYQPTSISGTLQWMAPEVISGKIIHLVSDVFSLGTIVWELLSETVPFSDVQDPAKPNFTKMRDALNMRDLGMGGWPFGPEDPSRYRDLIAMLCQHTQTNTR